MDLTMIEMFCLLIACHYLADFPLQGQFLSDAKNRNNDIGKYIWKHALFGHSCIHGLFVGLITGHVVLGLVEVLVHAMTDFLKCENRINFNQDQLIHVMSKFLYVAIIYFGAF